MKEYLFTYDEALLIRDSLIEEYQRRQEVMRERGQKVLSPHGKKVMSTLEALKDQFKTDCHNWRE